MPLANESVAVSLRETNLLSRSERPTLHQLASISIGQTADCSGFAQRRGAAPTMIPIAARPRFSLLRTAGAASGGTLFLGAAADLLVASARVVASFWDASCEFRRNSPTVTRIITHATTIHSRRCVGRDFVHTT